VEGGPWRSWIPNLIQLKIQETLRHSRTVFSFSRVFIRVGAKTLSPRIVRPRPFFRAGIAITYTRLYVSRMFTRYPRKYSCDGPSARRPCCRIPISKRSRLLDSLNKIAASVPHSILFGLHFSPANSNLRHRTGFPHPNAKAPPMATKPTELVTSLHHVLSRFLKYNISMNA